MTEAEWRAATDPQPMLVDLLDRGGASERKLRLFAVACCQRILRLLPDSVRCREAVEEAERFADSHPPEAHRSKVLTAVAASTAAFAATAVGSPDGADAGAFAAHAAYAASSLTGTGYADDEAAVWSVAADAAGVEECFDAGELRCQADLLRDLFGNPSGPEAVKPSWLVRDGGKVVKLAQRIYEERAFHRLPVLADALEDAGCTDGDIVDHCRSGGEHVRGCWAVDLVLGRG
jgi:hypothetical protein